MSWSKFAKFLMSFSKPRVSFSSNLEWLFSVMKYNSSVLFQAKHYVLCTKGTNQSANFLDFLVLWSKFIKFLSFSKKNRFFFKFCTTLQYLQYFFSWNFIYTFNKRSLSVQKSLKVQKTYLLWRVMPSVKKNWLVISNMTWGIWWIFTQPLESPKISLWWAIFAQSI